MNVFCCFVNVHGVVVLFVGGADTQPLYVIRLFVLTGGGDPKT